MKQEKKKTRLWARYACLGVAGMLCLAACSSAAPSPQLLTKIQVERVTVPAALLRVDAAPTVPMSRMQSAAAEYLVRLKINDDECHQDVGLIAATQK